MKSSRNHRPWPKVYLNEMVYLLVVGAGGGIALQQLLNACMSNGPWLSEAMVARMSWITWTGGIFGAIFIGAATLSVPRLGAGIVPALIVVRQMLCSPVSDHLGLLGVPQHAANPTPRPGDLADPGRGLDS